jgi:hypothetical protein
MVTPLYKKIRENGTSFYAFPGAAEDISAAYQNSNYTMYFSKYILLDLPKQDLTDPGLTSSEYIYWNFASFSSISAIQPQTFAEQTIESLRNYVANQEITIRESRLNNTEYYYDTNALQNNQTFSFFWWFDSTANLIRIALNSNNGLVGSVGDSIIVNGTFSYIF